MDRRKRKEKWAWSHGWGQIDLGGLKTPLYISSAPLKVYVKLNGKQLQEGLFLSTGVTSGFSAKFSQRTK